MPSWTSFYDQVEPEVELPPTAMTVCQRINELTEWINDLEYSPAQIDEFQEMTLAELKAEREELRKRGCYCFDCRKEMSTE